MMSCLLVQDDPNLSGDNGEVPIFEWGGRRFDSHCEIFSLLDGKKLVRYVGSQEPTHCKLGNKPHLAQRGFLSRVGPTGSNSCRIAQCWLFTYLFIYCRILMTAYVKWEVCSRPHNPSSAWRQPYFLDESSHLINNCHQVHFKETTFCCRVLSFWRQTLITLFHFQKTIKGQCDSKQREDKETKLRCHFRVHITWYSWKRHMARKNVTNAVFSNTRKAGLNWSWKATFANYI